jgi:hypothetical protein
MQTNFNAAAVWARQLDVVVSVGVEMMSRVPMGSNSGDLSDKLHEGAGDVRRESRPGARLEWNSARALDAFSLESPAWAIAASDAGKFENEIVPVEVGAAGAAVLFAVDGRLAVLSREARLAPARSCRTGSSPPATRARSSTAPRRCSSPVRPLPVGLTSSRAPLRLFGLSGVDPYRMLHGNPEAARRSRRPGSVGTTSR